MKGRCQWITSVEPELVHCDKSVGFELKFEDGKFKKRFYKYCAEHSLQDDLVDQREFIQEIRFKSNKRY